MTDTLATLRLRHEARIAENAERIRDHIGYVLRQIEAGRADSTPMHAKDIAACAQRILASVAALEAVNEAAGILASGEPGEG